MSKIIYNYSYKHVYTNIFRKQNRNLMVKREVKLKSATKSSV